MNKNIPKTSIKKIVIALTLAIGVSTSVVPYSQAFAYSNEGLDTMDLSTIQTIQINTIQSNNEFEKKQESIEKYLEFKDGKYSISEDCIKNGELTKSEVVEINKFFQNTDLSKIESIEMSKALESQGISLRAGGIKDLPQVKIFLAGLAAFVGWELASNITEDFYHWGVKSACAKWKKVGPVRSFCKSNGYL